MRLMKRKSGFTLVELMIVIALIGILASTAIVGYRKYVQNSYRTEAWNVLGELCKAQKAYYLDHQIFATSFEEISGMKFSDPNSRVALNLSATDRAGAYYTYSLTATNRYVWDRLAGLVEISGGPAVASSDMLATLYNQHVEGGVLIADTGATGTNFIESWGTTVTETPEREIIGCWIYRDTAGSTGVASCGSSIVNGPVADARALLLLTLALVPLVFALVLRRRASRARAVRAD